MINATIVEKARKSGKVIPAFNIPYPEMAEPVAHAIIDENSIGMLMVARVEWENFGAKSLEVIANEYFKHKNDSHTLLHLDHIPAVDENNKICDFMSIIKRGIDSGYQSVMIDASRLPLTENIEATSKVVELAHNAKICCEAELGKVSGHESGPRLPYEVIFKDRVGFTDIDESIIFAKETKCDWLSVAVGSVHGSVADNLKFEKKPAAMLDIEHISNIYNQINLPLVLHGGSGIKLDYIHAAVKAGIAKINIGTEIRQTYLKNLEQKNQIAAIDAVYNNVRSILSDDLKIKDLASLLI